MRRLFAPINRALRGGCLACDYSSFRFWDNLVGWVVFAIATISYWATMEPTTSLWDCSEYIATSYKLEVGHPPGAPLYMMLARIASLFAPSPEYVPMMINGMNCLVSGFTILFTFWTITHLARRVMGRCGETLSGDNMVLALGAGVIGALSYAYTDTFWFSAVEGEVYAMSSMFTALVVWLMFKWEENADSPTSMRWIILIAYLMGLSIGVHILNLLTIPALVMIYFFRRFEMTSLWRYLLMIVAALLVSMLILGFINGIIIPYTVLLGAYVDTFAVNTLGLPVNVGMLVYVFVVFALLGWLICFSHVRKWRVTNIVALCLTVILLGFSSYAMMTIRANANPPMNSNNPSNPHMLLSVLNRDQYGDRPLLRGPYYNARPLPVVREKTPIASVDGDVRYVDRYTPTGNLEMTMSMWYNPESKSYEEYLSEWNYIYPEDAYHYFPRMWFHARAKDYELYVDDPQRCSDAEAGTWTEPSAGDDLGFFMSYQMGDMFWRYFMWNFVGRQDDVQLQKCEVNDGTYLHGGWLSGIDFIDEVFCGPQDKLPSDMANNPAHNTYFFLPLLLGLLGLVFHLISDTRNWFVVLLMFVMMGVALVVYFNTAPNEPRERDYVYAGAFYAFSIWIGMGVMAMGSLFKLIGEYVERRMSSPVKHIKYYAVSLALLLSLSVPVVLAVENWDDHDRSERYFARDIGRNFLNTVPENAILINYGDNDTFPLWYCQEVEGVRTDVKVMNSSYLDGMWYVDQMRLASNDAEGVPFTIPSDKYATMGGTTILSNEPGEYISDDKHLFEVFEELTKVLNHVDGRGIYTFQYEEFDVRGVATPAEIELMFEEVVKTCDDSYLEYGKLEDKYYENGALSDAEYSRYMTLRSLILALQATFEENSNHPFTKDYYGLYIEYYDVQSPKYIPTSLPLADAIAHYISDEPMWLIKSSGDDRWRIVETSDDFARDYPDYEYRGTLYPMIDSPLSGEPFNYLIYAKEYTIPVDVDAALKAGIITEEDVSAGRVVDEVRLTHSDKMLREFVSLGALMMYDLLGNYDWSRAICFTQTHIANDYGIADYLRFDGYSYTFVPILTPNSNAAYVGCMDIDRLYPLFMDECEDDALNQALCFGNLADEEVLADYFVRYNVQASGVMGNFARVARGFAERGTDDDLERAEALLDRGLAVLPPEKLGYSPVVIIDYIGCYYMLGDIYMSRGDALAAEYCYKKADSLNSRFVANQVEWITYYTEYLNKGYLTMDIARELVYKCRGVCDAVNLSHVGREQDHYDNVIRGCGKHCPESALTKLMQAIGRNIPEDISSELIYAMGQSDKHGKSMANYISAEYLPIYVLLEETAYNAEDGRDLFRSPTFTAARNEVLVKSGIDKLWGINLDVATHGGGGSGAAEISSEVQGVVDIYTKGLEAWERSTQSLKQAVELMASQVGVEVNVEKQDIFQYFYAYSDYAQQLSAMAVSRGVDLAEANRLIMLSEEDFALADEYLKMGDQAAVQLISQCAAEMDEAMKRAEAGNYVIDDALLIYVRMLDIIDVLSVSLEMAGSFDWVANDVGYADYGVEQVSFDSLMLRFVNIAAGHLHSPSAEKDVNKMFADIALRGGQLLPSQRNIDGKVVNADYVKPLLEYLNNPTVKQLCDEMYGK